MSFSMYNTFNAFNFFSYHCRTDLIFTRFREENDRSWRVSRRRARLNFKRLQSGIHIGENRFKIIYRVTGLLRAGALKEEDIPIWYAVYKAFPPQYEPRYDRPAPNVGIPNILYSEDEIRARFQKQCSKQLATIDMNNHSTETTTQKFLSHYKRLQEEGNINEQDIFDSALTLINVDSMVFKEKQNLSVTKSLSDNLTKKIPESLASSFKEAQKRVSKSTAKDKINVEDLFK